MIPGPCLFTDRSGQAAGIPGSRFAKRRSESKQITGRRILGCLDLDTNEFPPNAQLSRTQSICPFGNIQIS